jgi:protein TonB
VVKPDEEVIDEELMPTIEELETADVGTENIEDLDSMILDQDIASFEELAIEEEIIEPYLQVEVMPSFPGGEQELLKYLAENVKYPRLAREAKIQGLVIVRFVVDADGFVGRVELLRIIERHWCRLR